ncbi:MAG: hypothetical protein HDT47_05765 [Ruminococcaceae bacterium]|nr:hypothetical protein [Oscillospiraceae bacterium]
MYAYNRSNVAYDLSQFDTDGRVRRQPKQSKAHLKMHKTSVAKSGNWFKTIVLVTFAAIVAFMFVNSKAALSEVSTEISSKSSELQEAKRENTRLQAQLDNMVTLSKVEEIAISELGLQKTAKSQVRYISVHDRTMVQVAEREENVFASLKNWLDSVSEYLGF